LVNDILRLKTFSSSFVIEVQQGDFVEVNSDKACEGSFSKLIDLIGVPIAYPNPTSGIFEMALPIEQKEVEVELYNLQSQLISSKSYPVVNGKVQLNISDKAIGMYIGKVHLDHPIIFKILKQ